MAPTDSPAHVEHPGSTGSLKKVITTRQFIFMALSSSIGAGLLLSTGQALAVGGPAPLFIGFAVVGLAVWITMCSLGELSTNFPVKGSFYEYSVWFISPSWGFSMGWNYVMNFICIVPFEVIVMVLVAHFINPGLPAEYLIPGFLVALMLIYVFGARWYAEAENVFGVLKMLVFTIFIMTAFFIVADAVPTDPRPASELGWHIWKNEAFKNGWAGFLFVFMSAGMAYGGTEMLGFTAAECVNPRKVMGLASRLVAGRVVGLYLLPILMVGLVLSIPLEDTAKEHTDTKTSPFVLAVARAGIPVLPQIMNGIILVAIFSMANASVFASSRALRAISSQGMGPKFCGLVKWDRPVGALIVVFLFSLLAFAKVSPDGDNVFTWLLALASASNYFTWMSICLCQIRCRLAIRKRGLDQHTVLPSYRSPFGIYGSVFAMLVFVFGLVAQIAAAVKSPLPSPPPVFASMLGIVVVAVFWVGYMCWKRDWTLLVPLKDIDLETKDAPESHEFESV
ncbi:Uu.00g105590.m01.CDS01 [Anthostomella pinea]|uniref:Uu.00g105590.m01.CDS01 n=1 Tax=Anthostomella pinea TaxID=933095 RepID=A0AAI8YFY2_9PEZI|nr:Uu.00g105590.m01.CDS01 [Anthostomella pinea]